MIGSVFKVFGFPSFRMSVLSYVCPSNSFIPILLKLYILKMSMRFGYNAQIILFLFFFSQFELSPFWGILTMTVCTLCAQPLLQFIPILLKLYKYLDHVLKMCMRFGYDALINVLLLFRNLNLVLFLTMTVCILCAQLLIQLYSDSFETLHIS